jgi:His/Glu/Gln/Arg/opine family amino acid ABC transporter permease subunit
VAWFLRQLQRTFIEQNRWQLFLEGFRNTIVITIVAVIIGVILGVIIAAVKVYNQHSGRLKIVERIFAAYVAVIRGTPMVVQLLIFAYIIIQSNNYIFVACIAFGLNSGAYVSEVVRAGIGAVDKGQREAGLSLGLPWSTVMRRVTLPQAVKNILPALCNEFIAVLKETSIAGYIAVVDLTRASDLVRSRTYEPYIPLLTIAIVYFILVDGLSKLTRMLEKHLAKSDRK